VICLLFDICDLEFLVTPADFRMKVSAFMSLFPDTSLGADYFFKLL
jgi:hypothetical protein